MFLHFFVEEGFVGGDHNAVGLSLKVVNYVLVIQSGLDVGDDGIVVAACLLHGVEPCVVLRLNLICYQWGIIAPIEDLFELPCPTIEDLVDVSSTLSFS